MSFRLGTARLSDEEFLAAFDACKLSAEEFGHADHLRLAWLHLQTQPVHCAIQTVRRAIQKFASHHGADNLYHETITCAWVRLIATHDEPTFEEFLSANEDRLSAKLLHQFYTPELLASPTAKRRWVAPDLHPLP